MVVKRQSNIELLRLVAMFLVLAFHANFWSLEKCYAEQQLLENFQTNFLRLLLINMEAGITSICVNLFILISGYFGIKLRKERILSFFFQCFFVSCIAFAVYFIANPSVRISLGVIMQLAISWFSTSWFVQCYFLLMLMAPVLNAFLSKISNRQLSFVACISIVVSSLLGGGNWGFYDFSHGYSLDFFIVLYIIGNWIARHLHIVKRMAKKLVLLYLLTLVLCVVFGLVKNAYMKENIDVSYNNIFVLGMSIIIFCIFVNLNFYSGTINWLAKGCFTVYLFHTSIYIRSYFQENIQKFYLEKETVLEFILPTLGLLLSFYIFSLLIDVVRRFAYNKIKQYYAGHTKK